jgi:molybdenum cofactor cytidylyltransferase
MAEITGVLLAAGFSTRFGHNKLLYEIDGQPLISYSASVLQPCDRIIAVVRNDDALITVLDQLGVDCVINDEPERGMGYSIAQAVKAASASNGWCLLPADMPYIQAATTQQLVNALHQGATIAAPFYHNHRRGHPVAFSDCFYDQLVTLDGDSGARSIIESNINHLAHIDTEDASVLMDIDTLEDIKQTEQ